MNFQNPWQTGIEVMADDGKAICLRRVNIDTAAGGAPIRIFQMTDIHFCCLNDEDRQDTSITDSFHYWYQADYEEVRTTFHRCMRYANSQNAAQVVLTGDLTNFYSHGALGEVKKQIFDRYDNVLVTAGNHEAARCDYNGELVRAHRQAVADFFAENGQDLTYLSKVIDGRVMLILLDNASLLDLKTDIVFTSEQQAALAADLAKARANEYTVLLFYHIPLACEKDSAAFQNQIKDEPSRAVYDLITGNADLIRGCFAGHTHEDAYTEIAATTSDGQAACIPQYVLTKLYETDGEMLEIIVR